MIRRLLRAAAVLLLVLASGAPVLAQPPTESAAAPVTAPTAPDRTDRPTSAPGLVLAFLTTILVLFIICKPARKR